MTWEFDQERNVAAITTRQVLNDGFPVLRVVHYEDDHSWAFTCGTTNKSEDLKIVGMGQIVDMDPTLHSIANLAPGWSAYRESTDAQWIRGKRDE